LQFIGNRASFAPRLLKNMLDVEELTCNNTGMVVTVAADYGGQWDIGQACRAIAMDVQAGLTDPADINTGSIQKYISLGTEPAPDLCIRTGGERRISNFLLWQMAYTELYFTDCYWPDFSDAELQLALDDFGHRQRRYGGNSSSDELTLAPGVARTPGVLSGSGA